MKCSACCFWYANRCHVMATLYEPDNWELENGCNCYQPRGMHDPPYDRYKGQSVLHNAFLQLKEKEKK